MGQPASSYRFILLPSLVGLVCYACSQKPDAIQTPEVSDRDRAIVMAEQPSTRLSEPVPTPQLATANSSIGDSAALSPLAESQKLSQSGVSPAYQAGVNLASSAYQLSQSAISPDDWGLVTSRWQRSIEQLKQVSSDSSSYEAAQAKAKEYSRNAEYAAQKVETLKTTARTTVTAGKLPIGKLPTTPTASTLPLNLRPPASSATAPVASSSAASNKTSVPVIRRLHGTPVVQVTFNGTKTYDMILDTGASRTLITRAMANELDIVATERMVAATASESEVIFELGKVESISMGGITLSNARVSIGDSVSVGLLGNDFLNGYDITIRGRENVVELVRS